MIKWQSNFNIPDATVQLAVAYVKVLSFKNIGSTSIADIEISDESGNTIVKQYQQYFEKTFGSEEEVYLEILPEFNPAELI